MPKIFISHSWEDNEIARKLAEYLRRDGVEVWIDYARIQGGDNLPRIISDAIDWCDTLILLWSNSAIKSYYVELEWTCALTNKKRIIPCLLDDSKFPTILTSKLYINFQSFELGYNRLARAIKIVIKEKEQNPIITLKTVNKKSERLSTKSETEKKYHERQKYNVKSPAAITSKKLKNWIKLFGLIAAFFVLFIIIFNNLINQETKKKNLEESINPNESKPAKMLQVEVLNGCRVAGVSKKVTDYLRHRNIDVVYFGNYDGGLISETLIIDRRDSNLSNAKIIGEIIGVDLNRIFPQISPQRQLDVTIVVGANYSKLKPFQ